MKKIFFSKRFLVVLIVIFFSILFLVLKPRKNVFNIKDFDIITVENGDILKTITANGTINPVNVINVGTQVSGTIRKIYVDYNDKVERGQRLAELDTSILEKEVAESLSSLKKARSTLDLDRLNYERNEELYRNNYIAKVELDQANTQLKNSTEEYNIARTRYDVSKINLSYAYINSPVSGVVISREVDIGQTVAANYSAPTLFQIAEDLNNMQIETSVSEADIGAVKEGQKVQFTIDSFPNVIFDGNIKQIRLNPTTVSNVVVYNVIIEIKNEENKLMPGMTAYVSIPVGEVKDVNKISSIVFRFSPDDNLLKIMNVEKPASKSGHSVLYKLIGKKVTPIYVKRGLSDISKTQIISDEIKEGDLIISNSVLINNKK